MSPRPTGRAPFTRREQLVRAAETVDVPVEDADRALILGQVAAFLVADRRIGPDIAFQGGAIMRLVDTSPRLSKDLDALVVTGKPIKRAWVEEALSTEEAQRVVLGIDPAGGSSGSALLLPIIHCRPLSGRGTAGGRGIVVQLSFSWSEPPLAKPVWSTFVLPDGQTATIPVLVAPERAAEKVRAYLTPFRVARANDAYDLFQYGSRILTGGQWGQPAAFVPRKLAHDTFEVLSGTDLHAVFDRYTDEIGAAWSASRRIVAVEPMPDWDDVREHVERFRRYVPQVRL